VQGRKARRRKGVVIGAAGRVVDVVLACGDIVESLVKFFDRDFSVEAAA
jgi:hypothetical protein